MSKDFRGANSIAVAQHALTQRSKGQGHTVMKTVMVHGC